LEENLGANLKGVCNFSSWDSQETVQGKFPSDWESVEYFYYDKNGELSILRKFTDEEKAQCHAKAEKERIKGEKRDKLGGIAKRAYDLRKQFVKEYSTKTADSEYFVDILVGILQKIRYIGRFEEEYAELGGKRENIKSYQKMLITWYVLVEDGEWLSYNDINGNHESSERLDYIYEVLMRLGYELSDEEREWKDGVHALFATAS